MMPRKVRKDFVPFPVVFAVVENVVFFVFFFSPIKTYNFYIERNDFSFQSEISPCNRIFSSEVVCDKYQVCIRVAQTVRCQIPL